MTLYANMNHVGEVYFLSLIRNSHFFFHLRCFKYYIKVNFQILTPISFLNYLGPITNLIPEIFFFRTRSFGKYLR